MHVLNFLIAILLPYVTLFSKLGPTGLVPGYFFSNEAAFVASEFGAIVFYWAGFLRDSVDAGRMTEQQYWARLTLLFIFMVASKIIYALPYFWFTGLVACGLGFLSTTPGQTRGKKSMAFLVLVSLGMLGFCTYILIGMAWFNFTAADYHYYKMIVFDFIENHTGGIFD